jgi:hypothetical protein
LVPETAVVPVTAKVGVEDPEREIPLTLEGVMAPKEKVIFAAVVGFATEAETPFAVVTATEVTVPVPPTAISPDPKSEVPPTVFILVPEIRVACFPERAVTAASDKGLFASEVLSTLPKERSDLLKETFE